MSQGKGSSTVIYVQGDSLLHRIRPVSKLMMAVSVVMMAIATTGVIGEAILVFVTLIAVLASKVALHHYWRIGKFLLLVGLSWAITAPLVHTRAGAAVMLHLPFKDITYEGVEFGLNIGMRFLILGFSSLTFIFTTRPVDLVQDLNNSGLPYRYAHAISLGVVFLPIILDEVRVIRQAQVVRNVGGNRNRLSKWFQRVRHLLITLVIRSLRRGQQMAIALDAKGFGRHQDRTYMRDLEEPLIGRILGYGSVGAMVAYLVYLAISKGIPGITYIQG